MVPVQLAKEHPTSIHDSKDSGLETLKLGVYNLYLERQPFSFLEQLKKWQSIFAIILKVISEVYTLAPTLFLLHIFAKVSKGIEAVILLHYETRIVQTVEVGLLQGSINSRALFNAVMARLLCVVIVGAIYYPRERLENQLRVRVLHHFDEYLLTSRLSMDLSLIADNLSDEHLSAETAWSCAQRIMSMASELFGLISCLGFVIHIGHKSNYGALFSVCCVFGPLLRVVNRPSLNAKPRVIEATNTHFLRMRALRALSQNLFRSDVISGNIVQYIINEFRRSRVALGDTDTDHPENIARIHQKSWIEEMIYDIVDDFPTLFSAIFALAQPTSTVLSTLVSLHESASLLRRSFWNIYWEMSNLLSESSSMELLYEFGKKETKIKDGTISYPLSTSAPKGGSDEGMAIELRNVSFSYPGNNTKALDNVSLSIRPGQLVVVVGANGSGKSTFVKLISRLYDAESGSVLIDGEEIQRYKLQSLRQAIATLTQDHHLYPLSIHENIGLGFLEAVDNTEMIQEAARKGCATDVIDKLSNGLETVLDPQSIQYFYRVQEGEKSKLAEKLKSFEKSADVSGGERQRLVAARTFMRLNSGKVRLVGVDEPSSALDPKAELELFDNLRNSREAKTVIFVTHRFGHLTKHADVIFCMSKGRMTESGTHTELMELGGEYSKMYNIQAKAFETE